VRVCRRMLSAAVNPLPYPRAAVAVAVARRVAEGAQLGNGIGKAGRDSSENTRGQGLRPLSHHHHHRAHEDKGDVEMGKFEFLLVKRRNPPGAGTWSLPGGKIDVGETVVQAGQRELLEETGIAPESVEWLHETAGYSDVIVRAAPPSNHPEFHYVITQLVALVRSDDDVAAAAAPRVEALAADDAEEVRWETVQRLASGNVPMTGFDVVKHLTKVEQLLASFVWRDVVAVAAVKEK
jgi:8-oxo-dGTP diphosphatase